MFQTNFYTNGYINGYPSWYGYDPSNNLLTIYYDTNGYWVMTGWVYGGQPRNYGPPTSLPLTNWFIFDSATGTNTAINITLGFCPVPTPTPTPTPTFLPQCNVVTTVSGSCLNENGGFVNSLSGWTSGPGTPTWNSTWGGSCAFDDEPFGSCIRQDILDVGATYQIEFDVLKTTSLQCAPSETYIIVYAGTNSSPVLLQGISGSEHIDITLTCLGNTEFKICAYSFCDDGPHIIIDNVCVNEIILPSFCDVTLYILDAECDPCFEETIPPTCQTKAVPPTVINGVIITESSTGSVENYNCQHTSCGGVTTPNNAKWLGKDGPFTYTINFSVPINDLKIFITATGHQGYENFLITTNNATPNITTIQSCFSYVVGNEIFSGLNAPTGTGNCIPGYSGGGGGEFIISNPTKFTSLTIQGNGGFYGSLFAFCADSIIQQTKGCLVTSTYSAATDNFVVVRTGSTQYSSAGTIFRSSSNLANTLNGDFTPKLILNSGIWSNSSPNNTTNGPLNRTAVYCPTGNTLPLEYQWIGQKFYTTCIDPNMTGKTFCIGVGGSEFSLNYIDNGLNVTQFITAASAYPWTTPSEKLNNWNVYEFTIQPNLMGVYFSIWGLRDKVWGFEIYDQPMSTLTAATTINDLKIIYSSSGLTSVDWTKNFFGTVQWPTGPNCPPGFYYSECLDKCMGRIDCSQSTDCLPCVQSPLPNPNNPVVQYGDIEMTYSYTGPTIPDYILSDSCDLYFDLPGSIFLGNQPGLASYTINFSKPVNNIQLFASGGGAYFLPGEEEFIFSTNAGLPVLVDCGVGCNSRVEENRMYSQFVISTIGAIQFKVSAETEFTELTITTNGGLAGMIFTYCVKDIIDIFNENPELVSIKTAYVYYDIIGAPPLPSPPPSAYTAYVYYTI